MKDFGCKFAKEGEEFLAFEKENLWRNLFAFSFDTRCKQVFNSSVGEEDTPVTAVSVSFSVPFLQLSRGDLLTIKSFTEYERAPESPERTVAASRLSPRLREEPR